MPRRVYLLGVGLALVAAWFLTQETRRGKKTYAGADGPAGALGGSAVAPAGVGV